MGENSVQVFTAADLTLRRAAPGSKYWCVRLPRVMVTYFAVDPHTVFDAHAHESEQITYVLRGTLEFEVEGKTLSVHAGEAIRLPANVRHAVRTLGDSVEALDAWSPPGEAPWDGEAPEVRKIGSPSLPGPLR